MLAIGSDHGGFELKNHIIKHLEEKGLEYMDFGCYDEKSVDYPDIAQIVCNSINNGECERGILICGTGIGISIAAVVVIARYLKSITNDYNGYYKNK